MKLTRILATTAMLGVLAAPAFAGEVSNGNTYAKLSGGAIIPEDIDGTVGGSTGTLTFDTGWTVSGAIGYRLSQWVSIEGEVGYLDASLDKFKFGGVDYNLDGDFSSVLGLVNLNLHPSTGAFDPYIGAGIGAAHSKIDLNSINGTPVNESDSSTDFAAQGTVGLNYAVSAGTSIGAQYRYLWTDTGGNGTDAFTAHSVTAHVTVAF